MKGWNLQAFQQVLVSLVKAPEQVLAHQTVQDIRQIPFAKLKEGGIKGIVFDKDNTLTLPKNDYVETYLKQAVEECKQVFQDQAVIFSNSAGSYDDHDFSHAKNLQQSVGLPVVCHGTKKPHGIEALTKQLDCRSDELIMVGDRHFTDVLFGNMHGMLTIRTEQLSNEGETRMNLKMQAIESKIIQSLKSRGYNAPDHPLAHILTEECDKT